MEGIKGIEYPDGNILKLLFKVCSSQQAETRIHFESVSLKNTILVSKSMSEVKDGIVNIRSTNNIDNPSGLAKMFTLDQNYPNPFNALTTINYQIATQTKVSISIYDITGRIINTVVNDNKSPGKYSVIWNGRNTYGKPLASGIYFYQIETDSFIKTRKMLLVK